MYTQNFIAMEKEKELQGCSKIIPGLIIKTGIGQTSPISKATKYIFFLLKTCHQVADSI